MAFKPQNSPEGYSAELDLFRTTPTDVGIESIEYSDCRPTTQVGQNQNAIEFSISGSSMKYISLQQTKLQLSIRLEKGDGQDITAADNVGLVNLPLQTLFSTVDLELNQVPTTHIGNNYGYKAYLDTLLNYGQDAKFSQLQSQLYYPDTPEHFNSTDVRGGLNFGLMWRTGFAENSKIIDLEGNLFLDLAQQDRKSVV